MNSVAYLVQCGGIADVYKRTSAYMRTEMFETIYSYIS